MDSNLLIIYLTVLLAILGGSSWFCATQKFSSPALSPAIELVSASGIAGTLVYAYRAGISKDTLTWLCAARL